MNTPKRIVPEKGIPVSEEKLEELADSAAELLELIDDVQSEPDFRELLPDVEIFYYAVQYAIEQDIFYEEEDVQAALAEHAKAGHDDEAGGHHRLACHTACWIDFKNCIEN